MKERFITLEAFFMEDDMLFFHDLKINPFSIESYYETSIGWTNEDGEHLDGPAVKLFTKSGFDYDVRISLEDFEVAISQ